MCICVFDCNTIFAQTKYTQKIGAKAKNFAAAFCVFVYLCAS